jgi:hypothetical protein
MTSTTPQSATVRCEGVEVASGDEEIKRASKQSFTAYELAMRRGHHPQLFLAVKGSVFQALYEMNIVQRHKGVVRHE